MKKKKLIIGLGTGRCGTKSLSRVLQSAGYSVSHEGDPLLPWCFDEKTAKTKIDQMLKDSVAGDVCMSWLNYVEYVMGRPDIDSFFVCLKRDREDTIASFMRKTEPPRRDHWRVHRPGYTPCDRFDRVFPTYDVRTKHDAIGLYWDEYYEKADALAEKYPERFMIVSTETLNSEDGVRRIARHCQLDSSEIQAGIRINCTGGKRTGTPVRKVENTDLSDVTAVVKSFKRPEKLATLIASIRRYYPRLKVIVGDDNDVPCNIPEDQYTEVIQLPRNCGVCIGRNKLVQAVKTTYALLLEDDFIFSEDTDIAEMLRVLLSANMDLVSGRVYDLRANGASRFIPFAGSIRRTGNTVFVKMGDASSTGDGWSQYDLVLNFFLAKTQLLRNFPWDETLKTGEHMIYFTNLKGHARIAEAHNVVIKHDKINKDTPEYKEHRNKATAYLAGYIQKNQLTFIITYQNGRVITRAPGEEVNIQDGGRKTGRARCDTPAPKAAATTTGGVRKHRVTLPGRVGTLGVLPIDQMLRRQTIKIEILKGVYSAMDEMQLRPWLMCGTLLGYYRQGSLLPHDPDMDLGLLKHDYARIDRDLLLKYGMTVYKEREGVLKICRMEDKSVYQAPVHLDIFGMDRDADGVSFNSPDLCYKYSDFDIIATQFHGVRCWIPDNPLRQLTEHYGAWQVPVESWRYNVDPINMSSLPEDYWDKFYRNSVERDPSPFAIWCSDQPQFNGKVLELAPGCGRDMRWFARKHAVVGVEQSRWAVTALSSSDGLECICGDISHIDRDVVGEFDTVYSRFSLHSLTELNETRAIDSVAQCLKGGGCFFIETRSKRDPLYGKGIKLQGDAFYSDHYRRFTTLPRLRNKLIRAGFEVVYEEVSDRFSPGPEGDPALIRIIAKKLEYPVRIEDGLPVTAVIKAFERPTDVIRCVESVRRFYPDMPIVVVDDSADNNPKVQDDNLTWVQADYDIGLSAGRNLALEHVRTPYFLLLDDDFVVTQSTDIRRLYGNLLEAGVDIMGGGVYNLHKGPGLDHYEGFIEKGSGCIKVDLRKFTGEYDLCELVFNFFIGNTARVQSVGWDGNLKMCEHVDFFLRCKGNLSVGYCPVVTITHDRRGKRDDSAYMSKRAARSALFLRKMLSKYGATRIDYRASVTGASVAEGATPKVQKQVAAPRIKDNVKGVGPRVIRQPVKACNKRRRGGDWSVRIQP